MTSKALITGASAGLGAAYADRLAKRGHDLILVARGEDKLRELAARLPVDAEVLVADLTVPADVERVAARLDEVDVFVNNAGMSYASPVADADPAELQRVIDLNVSAFTRLAQAFAARREGTLINIASVVPILHLEGMAAYTASKAYALTFTQVLAAELAGTNMRIQAVLPGAVGTELWDKSGFPLANLDPEIVMPIADAVDAALAGLDAGELITILSLPDAADWEAYEAARLALVPNMSRRRPAERYLVSDLPGTALSR
jgi:short-subunit dehydrogenase